MAGANIRLNHNSNLYPNRLIPAIQLPALFYQYKRLAAEK